MYGLLANAGNAVVETVETSSQGGWVGIVVTVIASLVTIFLLPWLRQKANAAREEARMHAANANETELTNIEQLKNSATWFVMDTAADIAEKNFPKLAQRIKDGEFSGDDKMEKVKEELRSWGASLRDSAIEHFDGQGIDIVVALGDHYLDKLIEHAANKVSPFPGRDTARALLMDADGKAIEWLLEKGVKWVKNRYSKDD